MTLQQLIDFYDEHGLSYDTELDVFDTEAADSVEEIDVEYEPETYGEKVYLTI